LRHYVCAQLALNLLAVGEGPGEAREDVGHRREPGVE
jgi:hypothetical protein